MMLTQLSSTWNQIVSDIAPDHLDTAIVTISTFGSAEFKICNTVVANINPDHHRTHIAYLLPPNSPKALGETWTDETEFNVVAIQLLPKILTKLLPHFATFGKIKAMKV
jgi:hypothetical protein